MNFLRYQYQALTLLLAYVPDLKPFLNLLLIVLICLILPVPGPVLYLLLRFQLTILFIIKI